LSLRLGRVTSCLLFPLPGRQLHSALIADIAMARRWSWSGVAGGLLSPLYYFCCLPPSHSPSPLPPRAFLLLVQLLPSLLISGRSAMHSSNRAAASSRRGAHIAALRHTSAIPCEMFCRGARSRCQPTRFGPLDVPPRSQKPTGPSWHPLSAHRLPDRATVWSAALLPVLCMRHAYENVC